jgi:polyisoprenoid-binding protein YceI
MSDFLGGKEQHMKSTYQIDSSHSSIHFSIRHMMISNVRGAFTVVKGSAIYDPDNPSQSSVHAEIDVNSIQTYDEKRNEHLKSADFFDLPKFPHIVFDSQKIEKKGDDYLITGDLVIRGITREAVLKAEAPTQETKDPWGNLRIGVSASTKISRKDFGIEFNSALDTGGVLIGDEVKIDFEIELVKAQQAAA